MSEQQDSAAGAMSSRFAYELVSALTQALGHQLRTPLSVVSNDLHYFKGLLPAGECERAIRRCREISEVLRGAALVDAATMNDQEHIDVAQVFSEISFSLEVCAPRENLEQLNRALRTLHARTAATGAVFTVRVEKDGACGRILVTWLRDATREWPEAEVSSCTHYFYRLCRLDLVEPMLIDAIMLSLGGEVRVQATEATLCLTLCFKRPLV